MTWLLLAAMLAGMMPATAYAAAGDGSPNTERDETGYGYGYGYEEGMPRGRHKHTEECYTDELICTKVERIATASNATGSNADTGHEHTQKCYRLDCPYQQAKSRMAVYAGGGYSFQDDTGELTVSDRDGTVAWRESPDIEKEKVKSVVLEAGVTSIGEDAFRDCNNLTDVDASACINLEKIEDHAFAACKNLRAVDFSACTKLQVIGGYSFLDCNSLAQAELPDSVTSIGGMVFENCTNLTLSSLPEKLVTIGPEAFAYCTNLDLASLPDGLETIGSFAFYRCENLTLTSLPESVTEIKNSAFSLCTKLALQTLPSSLTVIKQYVFNGCRNLKLTELPDQLAVVESHAFDGCTDLALTTLPDSLTKIESAAFYDCTGIMIPTLPAGLVSIGDNAFNKGTGSDSLTFLGMTAPSLGKKALGKNDNLIVFVPRGATGYDGENWPAGRVVYCAALANLTISTGTFVPEFFPGTYTYAVSVPGDVESVSITPAAHDSETITVDGTGVASGDSSGRIALKPDSITTIRVAVKNSEQDTSTYTIKVTRGTPAIVPVTGVTLDRTELTLYTNQSPSTAALTATVQPADAADQTVVWNSSAPNVAAVDSRGNVTAVSDGLAVITVTTVDGGRTASCTVTVKTGSSSEPGDTGGHTGGNSSYDNGPDYYYRALTDKATGIMVSGSQIHENANLTVRPGELHNSGETGCDLIRSSQGAGRVVSSYDVSLTRGFLGNVTVSIPVEGWDGQKMTVVRCVGGNLVFADVTVDKGRAVISVDSLSPIALLNGVYTPDTLAASLAGAPAALPSNTGSGQRYQVKKGDTLSEVALRYRCTVAELMAANPIIRNPNIIFPGWVIDIP